jgi:hypothetical protein
MIIEKYTEDLAKYISLVHEATEGRYELTGYDICVIEAALLQLQDVEKLDDERLRSINNGIAEVFMTISKYLPLHVTLSLDKLRIIMMQDISNLTLIPQKQVIKPVRLQRSRKKGFNAKKLSKETNGLDFVYVGRGSKWGSPFVVGKTFEDISIIRSMKIKAEWLPIMDNAFSVIYYRRYIDWAINNDPVKFDLHELTGHNLMCWCGLDEPCHADYLIEISNK